jgi:phenolphthiocerol/phthiocerol/phthiodiolone dimycocerosyl transferase
MSFPASLVRPLSRSEEMFADMQNYMGLATHVTGPIDVDAMSDAFDAVLRAHPILNAHLERRPDGRHQFVGDDLLHPGIRVLESVEGSSPAGANVELDQYVSLINLDLRLTDQGGELCLRIHHSLADGQHQFALVHEFFSHYTDLVCTGSISDVTVNPAPESLEALLAKRGIQKQRRSGIERFMPAMFAYDLPPSRRADTGETPAKPISVPAARCWLTERETRDLMALCQENRVSLSTVVSAAVLLAEWQFRGTPNIPIPYIYPVDLRYLLSPPISSTGSTNPLGVATYLAEIESDTDIVELASDIAHTFRTDLSDGVIQQSLLHFSPQYVGNPPGLPDVVMCTDGGPAPTMRTPDTMAIDGVHGEMWMTASAGVDIYCTGIFLDRLWLEHYSHAPGAEKRVEGIHAVLCSAPSQYGWAME